MRQITTADRTVVQQSMTVLGQDYAAVLDSTKTFLCAVLTVQMADAADNRIADQYEDHRGYLHTCTVRVIEDGSGGGSVDIPHVVITPDRRTGILEYYEDLPRPTSFSVYGDQIDGEHHGVDPYSLDGDFCVVGFLGGQIDLPYIVRWWPHARNVFDPATSGDGNPDFLGNGTSLDQSNRLFSRVNGVETVITGEGNVYLSTHLSGSAIEPGGTPKNGRFARKEVDEGGSIRVQVKSSQVFEMDWNPQEDGIGTDNVTDGSLPQTNPQTGIPFTAVHNGITPLPNTYHRVDGTTIYTEVPNSIEVVNHGVMDYTGEDTITVNLVPGLENPLPNLAVTSVGMINLASVGASAVTSASALALTAPQLSILVGTVDSPPTVPPSIDLGAEPGTVFPDLSVALDFQALLTEATADVWAAAQPAVNVLATSAATAIAAASSGPPDATKNLAAIVAIGAYIVGLQAMLNSISTTMSTPGVGQTITTKAN